MHAAQLVGEAELFEPQEGPHLGNALDLVADPFGRPGAQVERSLHLRHLAAARRNQEDASRGELVCAIGEDGLLAASLGHFDEAEYERQLEHGVGS